MWVERAGAASAFSLGSLFCRSASRVPVSGGLGRRVAVLFSYVCSGSWAIQTPVQASFGTLMVILTCSSSPLLKSLFTLFGSHLCLFFLFLCFLFPLSHISSSVFPSLPSHSSFSFCILPGILSPESLLIPF